MSQRRRYVTATTVDPCMDIPPVARLMPAAPLVTTTIRQFPWANDNLLGSVTLPNGDVLPPYFRSTTSLFPSSQDVSEKSKVPLGLVISPSKVHGVPMIDCSQSNLTHCRQCYSYLSPFIKMTADQKNWVCPFCLMANPIVHTLTDFAPMTNRIETTVQAYDIVAPQGMSTSNSTCPLFLIMVDVSTPSVTVGFHAQFLMSVKASVESLADTYQVGLITLSDTLTAYNFNMMSEVVISDLTDIPEVSGFTAPLSECRSMLNNAIDVLIKRKTAPHAFGHCIGSGLEFAEKLIKDTGGSVVVGMVGIPQIGPHSLKQRPESDNNEVAMLRLPPDGSGKFFRDISFSLNRIGVSLNMFCVGPTFADLPVVAVPSGLTGGRCFYYESFDQINRTQLHNDIFNCLTQNYFWDCSMKLMCTSGVTIKRPHSNCALRQGNLVSFPILNPSDSVVFELGISGNITDPNVIFQTSVIWTRKDKVRMVRVLNFALPISSEPKAIACSVDEVALATLITRQAMISILSNGPLAASNEFTRIASQMSAAGTKMMILPYLIHSLLCNEMMRQDSGLSSDGRISKIIRMRGISPVDLVLTLYPKMFAINGSARIVPLCGESFQHGYSFLVHSVDQLFLWVSPSCPQHYLENVFGVDKPEKLGKELQKLQTPESIALWTLIESCWAFSGKYLPLEVIRPGSEREKIFSKILVDDSKTCGSPLSTWIQNTL